MTTTTTPQNFDFPAASPPPATPLIDTLLINPINFASTDTPVSPAAARMIYKYYLIALSFHSLLPTRPILAIIGPTGSGKTSALRNIGLMLYGAAYTVTPLPEKADDFDATCQPPRFVAYDNVDSTPPKWWLDRICCVATGATVTKRRLYTDSEQADIRYRCFLALTARTPRFGRDDVVDRLIILNTDSISTHDPESLIQSRIMAARNAMRAEYARLCQHALRAFAAYPPSHPDINPLPFRFRLADFASFCYRIALYSGPQAACDAQDAFNSLRLAQSDFTLEATPLIPVLHAYVAKRVEATAIEANDTGSVDPRLLRPPLIHELLEDLNAIYRAQHSGALLHYATMQPKAFARVFKSLIPNLSEYFDIKLIEDRAAHADRYDIREKK